MNVLSSSLHNLVRNWQSSVATVIVLALLLAMFSGLFDISQKAKMTLDRLQEKFSITVYLKDDADPFDVGKLITELEARSDVKKPVVYTSKEEAWKRMSKTFPLDPELLAKYRFSLPASVTITPKTLSGAPAVSAFLDRRAKNLLKEPADAKQKQKTIIDQMIEFVQQAENSVQKTIIFFVALFVIGGSLLLASTIHLGILLRKREITIMKLIGASKEKLMLPFMLEGMMLAIVAFLVHLPLIFILPIERNPNVLLGELMVITVFSTVVSYYAAQKTFRSHS